MGNRYTTIRPLKISRQNYFLTKETKEIVTEIKGV